MKLDDVKSLKEYEVINEREAGDINSQGMLLLHKKSGARVLLFSNDDDNKVFYIGFRTPPVDNTGLTHILEHSVLCGSKKYPLKDPFVELAKGSLNTFLNAMTYPDKTVYPIASCNDKDFDNLMRVYLDAVFYPNIYSEEKIFRQEGWHYELNGPDDELTINGVVYNEMKGVFSSPDSTLDREVFNSLFPETAYGLESGGDPVYIPELSYERFLDFHRTYYHPANSYIYLYGDMDMAEKLTLIDREYLSAFDRIEVSSKIKVQNSFSKPERVVKPYGITNEESEEDATYLSYNFVIDTCLNKELYVAFQIIENALIAAPGSILNQTLLDEGIGNDIQSMFENGIYQPYFSIIAKNASEEDEERFIRVVRETLERVVKEGIDKKALRAAINSLEFQYREADYGSYPKGLVYGLNALDSWLYDEKDPYMHVLANETYALMRKKAETGYFEELVEKYLLKNTHASVVILTPKKGLNAGKDNELREKLAKYKSSLSEEEVDKIIENTAALKSYQEAADSPEALASIPLLKISDIKREARPFIYKEDEVSGVPLLTHKIFTNGIGYLTLSFRCDKLADEDMKYVGLLKNILTMVSTEHYTYNQLFNEINENSGGLRPGVSIVYDAKDPDIFVPRFDINIKVFSDRLAFAFRIIKEILTSSKLDDEKRLKELLLMFKSGMQETLVSAGNQAAAMQAGTNYSRSAVLSSKLSGMEIFRYMESLCADFDGGKEELISGLKRCMEVIFRKENLFVDYIESDPENSPLKDLVTEFIGCLFTGPYEKKELVLTPVKRNLGYKTAAKVNYVAMAGNFRQHGFEYTGALRVLRGLLGYDYLWNNVRVRGGAYGCSSSFSRTGNVFFASYRDPNLKNTVEIYRGIADFIEGYDPDERDLTKCIIGAISILDTPLTPSAEGARSMSAYLSGDTFEFVQKERDEVLGCRKEDLNRLSELVRAVVSDNNLCVVGAEEQIDTDRALFDEVENLFQTGGDI
ncbi:MAG: insulinase family protein [Lachnospiraceae bacterium]|nr:insulinase family protein [Lachnospiraceae bacterium]